MPDLTADRYATLLLPYNSPSGPRLSLVLTLAESDRIIAALRALEESEQNANEIRWEANGDGTHDAFRNHTLVGSVRWNRHEGTWAWRINGGEWFLESSKPTAKAAVEKAVLEAVRGER